MDLAGKTIGLLGLGQIGGSLAWALRTNCPQSTLIAFDVKAELLTQATEQAMLDRVAADAGDLVAKCDILIIALPIDGIIEVISTMASTLREKHLVTDVGSIMTDVIKAAEAADLSNYVSGHPLAGSEKRGAEAWSADLFAGSSYFMTGASSVTEEALEAMRAVVDAVGAKPVKVAAMPHDLALSITSNVPHVLGYCLRRAYDRLSEKVPHKEMYICPSYVSATRVTKSENEMVFQMLWHNREYLTGALRSLATEVEIVRSALVDDEPEVLRRVLGLDQD